MPARDSDSRDSNSRDSVPNKATSNNDYRVAKKVTSNGDSRVQCATSDAESCQSASATTGEGSRQPPGPVPRRHVVRVRRPSRTSPQRPKTCEQSCQSEAATNNKDPCQPASATKNGDFCRPKGPIPRHPFSGVLRPRDALVHPAILLKSPARDAAFWRKRGLVCLAIIAFVASVGRAPPPAKERCHAWPRSRVQIW